MTWATGENAIANEIQNIDHFVAGETIADGDAVSLNYSDYKIYKASAAAFDHRLNFIGFAMEAGSLDSPIQINCFTVVKEKSSLTANTEYYLSDTQGGISSTAGTFHRVIGRAVSTSLIVRKRGIVSKPINIGTGIPFTAPCDLFFTGSDDGATPDMTIEGVQIQIVASAGFAMVRMGQTFTHDGIYDHLFATLLDSGGFM